MKTIDKRIFKALEDEPKQLKAFQTIKNLTPLMYSLAISGVALEIASKELYKK